MKKESVQSSIKRFQDLIGTGLKHTIWYPPMLLHERDFPLLRLSRWGYRNEHSFEWHERARRYTQREPKTLKSKVSHQIRVGKSSWQVWERVSVLLFIYCLQGRSDNARNTGYICMSGGGVRRSSPVFSNQERRWIRGDRRVGRNRSITKPSEIRAIHFTDHSEKSIGSLGDWRDPPFVLGTLYSSGSLEWLLGTRVGGGWYKVWFLGSWSERCWN